MREISEIRSMQAFVDAERRAGRTIALVPTMGALHEGHLSLVRQARERADTVVVSIFVNPIQFNSKSDFEKYPRTEDRDAALLRNEGVDVLFQPTASDMYPDGFQTRVEVTEVSKPLCGAHRPGHFAGVATVVSKLLLAVKPHVAIFGEKDYQQLQVIRRMVRDLNFDLEIVPGRTVREADGLAMSSRNVRLSPVERVLSVAIPRAIAAIQDRAAAGDGNVAALVSGFRRTVEEAGGRTEYAEFRHPETLEAVSSLAESAVFAVAVWVGDVRLIDNAIVEPAAASARRAAYGD